MANYFRGSIDELAIYDRQLSASEIEASYAAGTAGKCHAPAVPVTGLIGVVIAMVGVVLGMASLRMLGSVRVRLAA